MNRDKIRSAPGGFRECFPVSWVFPLLVTGLFVLRRAAQMGPLPSGLDGGEWLAIGDGLLGSPARFTGGAYAPLVPLVVAALARRIGPVDAVYLIAFVTWFALLVSMGLVASTVLSGWGTAIVMAIVASASTMVEPLAFGGYPQQLSQAGLIGGLAGLAFWLKHDSRRNWWMAAFGLSLAALSHHLYGLIAIGASLVVLGLAHLDADSRQRIREHPAAVLALPTLAAGLLLPTLLVMRADGYSPPFDATPRSVVDAWQYGTREAVALWTFLTLIALVVIAIQARGDRSPIWMVATAASSVAGLAFLIEPQPRLLPLLLAAVILAIASGAKMLPYQWRRSAALVTLFAVTIIVGRGDGEASAFFRYYQVLDASLISAARVVDQLNPPGVVAVRGGQAGWPIGWWVDGLTTAPVATGSDPRWLGFPIERTTAAATDRLFDGSLTPSALRNEARAAGVSTLVLRKWEWIGWDRWLKEPRPAVVTVFDDNVTLVLAIAPD